MLMICALSGRARARVVRRYAVIAGQSLSDSVFELGLTGSSPGPHNDAHIKYTNSTFSRRFLRRARRLALGLRARGGDVRAGAWPACLVSASRPRARRHTTARRPRGARGPGVAAVAAIRGPPSHPRDPPGSNPRRRLRPLISQPKFSCARCNEATALVRARSDMMQDSEYMADPLSGRGRSSRSPLRHRDCERLLAALQPPRVWLASLGLELAVACGSQSFNRLFRCDPVLGPVHTVNVQHWDVVLVL